MRLAVLIASAIVVAACATPPAAERVEERYTMVERQIAEPRDDRTPVTDEAVLAALRKVPRHAFVPERHRRDAYRDRPLPIGHGQTISQPYIVAFMTAMLDLDEDSRVLEIGTGSGYQAAVLAELTPHVYTIEIVEPLYEHARKALKEQGYLDRVHIRLGDGYKGWPEAAPFDAIIVTCAPEALPEPLWEQLAPGGRIAIPLGPVDQMQRLALVTKDEQGERHQETVMAVRFVPMTGEAENSGAAPAPR